MKTYKYLMGALTICPIEMGYSEEAYKRRFISFLENSDPSYAENIKREYLQALADPEWSWKAAASEAHFFGYSENDTEKDTLDYIKSFMGDVLFPD